MKQKAGAKRSVKEKSIASKQGSKLIIIQYHWKQSKRFVEFR